MQLSEYDKIKIDEILEGKPQYDWFSCYLLRWIASSKKNTLAAAFIFPDEVAAIGERVTSKGKAPSWETLYAKADWGNRMLLKRMIPEDQWKELG